MPRKASNYVAQVVGCVTYLLYRWLDVLHTYCAGGLLLYYILTVQVVGCVTYLLCRWLAVVHTLCSKKSDTPTHTDNSVNSQRIFKIPSLAHSLENWNWSSNQWNLTLILLPQSLPAIRKVSGSSHLSKTMAQCTQNVSLQHSCFTG